MSSSVSATPLVCTSNLMDLDLDLDLDMASSAPVRKILCAKPLLISKKSSPRIVVPAHTAARALGKSMDHTGGVSVSVPVITPKSSSRDSSGKEKVGRWSEEEHQVFLEGLEQHGKQWKVIAGMIGTRTVVQVRTHAQKYFQRMERHSIASQPQPVKRKMSLPTSMPSRSNKKPKGTPSKKQKTQRAASISLAPHEAQELYHELPTYPSYVSNTSSMSSDSNNWTISPSAVTETNDQFDIFETIVSTGGKEATEDIFDFKELGQDPLEWLVDAEPSILPESSLPVFPDLTPSSAGADDSNQHDHHYCPTIETHDYRDNHLVEDSHSNSSTGTEIYVDEDILSSIVDPNVTVQSLFLLPEE